MEGVRTFLESSTIHGLTYISTTRRLVKFFWILIVIGGFTGAGVLIYQSFDNWTDNPVTTTIETIPISEVRFPKITVCPPKNTFTDLNYDLMSVGNRTISPDTNSDDAQLFQLLLDQFVEYFQNKDFENQFEQFINSKGKDTYQNWYNGNTRVPIQLNRISRDSPNVEVQIDGKRIETYAETGEIASSFFGERFQADKFELDAIFTITIQNAFDNPLNISMEVQYDLEDHNTQWPNIIFGEFYENDLTTLDKNEHFYNFES